MLEPIINDAIDRHTLRRFLHVLTDVCYSRAEAASKVARTLPDGSGKDELFRQAEMWESLGRRVSETTRQAKDALL